MKYKQILTELLPQIRLLKKSHDLEGLEKLLTDTETFLSQPRLKTVPAVIKPVRRPATPELQTRYPDGKLIPTTWRPPVYEIPAGYLEGEGELDLIWLDARKRIRAATSAERENTNAANVKRFQLQPTIEAATDLGHEDGPRYELFEEEHSEYLLLLEVKIGKLNEINFTVDPCLPDMNTNGYSLQYPELSYYNQLYIDTIPFFTEIVGEIFNPELPAKVDTPNQKP